jgi:hypothetical protein
MQWFKMIRPIKNAYLMAFILMISLVNFYEKKSFAQNISLLNLPISMNNTAGEINSFNIFQLVSNPANLESIKKFNIGVFSERKFNLKELSNHLIVSGFTTGKMKFGIIIQQSGTSTFNQQFFGFCLSKKIAEKTSLAIQSSMLKNNISKFANQRYISAQVGLVTHLSKDIKLGFTASNFMSFNKQTTTENAYYLNIRTGLSYEISKQFSMYLNCTKTSHMPTIFSGIMLYKVHKKIALKLGFGSIANTTNVEIFYSGKKLNWALILSFHPSLGITPGTLISTNNE